jgi:succinyl-diaminopimelate desuccinylase
MAETDLISLTRELISINTVNPPGNESALALSLGDLLAENGFEIELPQYEGNRLHLVAEKGTGGPVAPLVLSGHLDTVPLGDKTWTREPFSGKIEGDRLYGRGSSDMKGGLAAMTMAAIEAMAGTSPEGGVRLIFSAGEEMGCMGVQQLVKSYKKLGKARAVIVGEPTSNMPAIGHKGALYLKASIKGKTAHSSMPELGVNAIYKAARCISKIETFRFTADKDPLLGFPSINVGKMEGGMNINSVPDHAEFTIDVRSTSRMEHRGVMEQLRRELGTELKMETLVDLGPVSTPETDPFVQLAYAVCRVYTGNPDWPRSLPYLTDGSVLQAFYGGVPTIILGPGEPAMAHQTDEYCSIKKLMQAVSIYKNIILNRRHEQD